MVQVPSVALAAYQAAAAETGVPAALLAAIGFAESGHRWWIPGDKDIVVVGAWCSMGLLQLQWCSGVGYGYTADQLADPELNALVGARHIAARYAQSGDWYAAIAAWSTRPLAWSLWSTYQAEGLEPVDDETYFVARYGAGVPPAHRRSPAPIVPPTRPAPMDPVLLAAAAGAGLLLVAAARRPRRAAFEGAS